MTSTSLRRNEIAAVEMTALAPGAGPPAKRIATRRKWWEAFGGRESDSLMESSGAGERRGEARGGGAKRGEAGRSEDQGAEEGRAGTDS